MWCDFCLLNLLLPRLVQHPKIRSRDAMFSAIMITLGRPWSCDLQGRSPTNRSPPEEYSCYIKHQLIRHGEHSSTWEFNYLDAALRLWSLSRDLFVPYHAHQGPSIAHTHVIMYIEYSRPTPLICPWSVIYILRSHFGTLRAMPWQEGGDTGMLLCLSIYLCN